jgi:hypothetical protein
MSASIKREYVRVRLFQNWLEKRLEQEERAEKGPGKGQKREKGCSRSCTIAHAAEVRFHHGISNFGVMLSI